MTPYVTVVGGTYHEQVTEPESHRLAGPGMRAAALLASMGHPVNLHTYVDKATAGEAFAVANALGVTLMTAPRSKPIRFSYATPLAHPIVSGSSNEKPLHVDEDFVVAFGLHEGSWSAKAAWMVIDPQHGRIPEGVFVEHLAVVLNAREAQHLTGAASLVAAGQALRTETNAEVVVVKNGIRGALAVTRGGVEHIGAHPTESVWPIGSGDAFTAGFASAWIHHADDPTRAARHASRVAATYCTTGALQVVPSHLNSLPHALSDREVTIYLAAPFFTVAQRWLVDHVRDALRELGVDVFSPLHEVGLGGDEVASADLAGLDRCDGMLALLDGQDPGTVFEVGVATQRCLPVVGYAERPQDPAWTMLRGTGAEIHADLATAIYRAGWRAISARGVTS